MNDEIHQKITNFFAPFPRKHFSEGSVIIQADHDPEGILFITSGVVEQHDSTTSGNKVVVNVFKPPAFFPMSWGINKAPNTYSFVALTDVEAQMASADATVEFLQNNPDITFDLLSRVYRGTDALLKRIVVGASGVASSRLIFELIIEAYRFGESLPDGSSRIKIKQHTLAARSRIARETVSRELHKLESERLIKFDGHYMIVRPKELESKL